MSSYVITGKFAILYTGPSSDAAWVFQTEEGLVPTPSAGRAGSSFGRLWRGVSRMTVGTGV